MRRRYRLGAAGLAVGASLLLASASRADNAETPDGLLQEAAKQAKYCLPPKSDWPRKKVSSNFDSCGDEIITLTKAVELSKKDAKIVEAASPRLTAAATNKAASALDIGRIYTQRDEQIPATGFLRLACSSLDDVSAFKKPTPEQTEALKAIEAEADQLLRGFQSSCKEAVAQKPSSD